MQCFDTSVLCMGDESCKLQRLCHEEKKDATVVDGEWHLVARVIDESSQIGVSTSSKIHLRLAFSRGSIFFIIMSNA
jgi:hypothetical protein